MKLLLLIGMGTIAIAVYRHWFVLLSNSKQVADTVSASPFMDVAYMDSDRADVRSGAEKLGERTMDKVNELTHKISPDSTCTSPGTISNTVTYSLSNTLLELEVGSKTVVYVHRKVAELLQTQLELTASQGSNLLVSGGVFESGKDETRITVEAAQDSYPGKIFIHAAGSPTLELNVLVRAKQ